MIDDIFSDAWWKRVEAAVTEPLAKKALERFHRLITHSMECPVCDDFARLYDLQKCPLFLAEEAET